MGAAALRKHPVSKREFREDLPVVPQPVGPPPWAPPIPPCVPAAAPPGPPPSSPMELFLMNNGDRDLESQQTDIGLMSPKDVALCSTKGWPLCGELFPNASTPQQSWARKPGADWVASNLVSF